MELSRIILRISGVIFEIPGTAEEILIFRFTGIPGGVQIVVVRTQFCNVPAMGATAITSN